MTDTIKKVRDAEATPAVTSAGPIRGIHHVALKAPGEEAFREAIAFYVDILGARPCREWIHFGGCPAAMLAVGDGIIEIFSDAPEALPAPGVIEHFALSCADVDAVVERVRSAGFAVTKEPEDIEIPSEPPLPARIAFIEGALGESIELFCEK